MSEQIEPLARVFSVGEWLIDGNALTASRGGESRPLEPKAFQVLRHLNERPGELVTIDELMDAQWAGTVVTPNAVSRVIAQLRKALDDDAKNPRYIETVARTGYRLIATDGREAVGPTTVRRRYAVLAAVAVALIVALWYALPGEPGDPTVAVLPFQNLTGSPESDYLGDGLAEEVNHSLSRIPSLRVRSQLQSFRYRDPGLDLAEIAEDLNVSYLVVGSVRQSGTNLRLSARLIDPRSGDVLRSVTEEYGTLELFEGQDAVSRGIAEALLDATGLPAAGLASTRPEPDSRAYDHYLRGRHIWHRRGTEPLQPAIDSFLEAVKIDPDFARGWAALATAYLTYPSYSPRGYATWNLAEEAAQKALELDPDIAVAYSVLAVFAHTRFEWIRSEDLYRKALELSDQDATAHYWYGQFLEIAGKRVASVRHIKRTIELDPTYLPPQLTMGITHYSFGDLDGASLYLDELWWDRGFRTTLSWLGNFVVAVLRSDSAAALDWIERGPIDAAQKRLLERFVNADLEGRLDPGLVTELKDFYWRRPDYPLGLWLLARLEGYDEVFALANNRLDRGLQLEFRSMWAPGTALRERPEFFELLDRIGLIDYWDASGWGSLCVKRENGIDCSAKHLTPDLLQRALLGDTRP